MKIKIFIILINLFVIFVKTYNNISFGFENKSIILLLKKENSNSNSNTSIKLSINTFIKSHYFPKIEQNEIEKFNLIKIENIFNLNDYDINLQIIKKWALDIEDFLRNKIKDSVKKIIKFFFSKINFSIKNNYFKNPYRIIYENNNNIEEVFFNEKFEKILLEKIFPIIFKENLDMFNKKIIEVVDSFLIELDFSKIITKKDSDCGNPFACRMSEDYSTSNIILNNYLLNKFNELLQKEIKENHYYDYSILLENFEFENKVYNGFFIDKYLNYDNDKDKDKENNKNNSKNKNLTGNNKIDNFYLFNNLKNNKKSLWRFESLNDFLNRFKKNEL
jgi:hypothetical protein